MDNVCNFSDLIKSKVISNSVGFLGDISSNYGISYDFSYADFVKFNNNLFSMYEYKKEIYKYEEDMEMFLIATMIDSIENNKKKISIEDILDGIFLVRTSNYEDNMKLRNKSLTKIIRIEEV